MPLFRLKHFSDFVTTNIFGIAYARVLKFHTCIAYEKFANPSFFSVGPFMLEIQPFSNIGILTNENLVSKISKEPFELGS